MKLCARYFYFALTILFSAVLLLGCIKGPQPNSNIADLLSQQNEENRNIKAINDKLFASTRSVPTMEDYVLGEGDLLKVSVLEAPKLKTEARVSARGRISLPLIGSVKVGGLTVSEAEKKIQRTYRANFIRNPHVSVFVKEEVSGKITLLGAFKTPGTYPYLCRQNLFQVMAMGGGLSKSAGTMVQVRRASTGSVHPQTYLIDLAGLTRGAEGNVNIPIDSGDVIYVPKAGTAYVYGAVRRPGNYPIKQQMTIPELLIESGGLLPYANQKAIMLVRSKSDGGKPYVVKLSMNDLEENPAHRIDVQNKDIVFVGSHRLAAIFSSLSIMGPFGGIGVNPGAQ